MTDQFELPSGLPEGPWTVDNNYVVDADDNEIVRGCHVWEQEKRERILRAIASIPAMVEEIGRLRELVLSPHGLAELENRTIECHRLRALNAELREIIAKAIPFMDAGHDPDECDLCETAERARAILAKSHPSTSAQEAAS